MAMCVSRQRSYSLSNSDTSITGHDETRISQSAENTVEGLHMPETNWTSGGNDPAEQRLPPLVRR